MSFEIKISNTELNLFKSHEYWQGKKPPENCQDIELMHVEYIHLGI